jgi:protein TonB
MRDASYQDFREESALQRWLPYGVVALLFLGLAYFVYQQMTAVHGVKVEAPSPQIVSMLPPPPPPPPPPPEPVEKPPEPTEQPQPAPNEAPKAPQPQPQAAPVTIAAPAQAGSDSFGLAAGSGGGIGAPGSGGTCLGTRCGASVGGGGMSEGFYRGYLSAALQGRVQNDERLARLAFSADFMLTVTADGRVSGVRLLGARGRNDEDTVKRLSEILAGIRGLDPPPSAMRFPQKITVRGRRPL